MREAGLLGAWSRHTVVEDLDLDLPEPSPRRGTLTSLINESAVVALAESLGALVKSTVGDGVFACVVGGDCTTLLGTIPALSAEVGLLFIDGHEDTMPLDVSEDGEAANSELGLLLGVTGKLLRGPLAERLPALAPAELAVLGPRDFHWRRQFNVGSLRDYGVWMRDRDEVAAAPSDHARDAVRHLQGTHLRWWLHIDLDVLDPEVFAAQGLPGVPDEPGGLTWEQLAAAATAAVSEGGCVGISVAVYDPEQDPDRHHAQEIVALLTDVAAAIT